MFIRLDWIKRTFSHPRIIFAPSTPSCLRLCSCFDSDSEYSRLPWRWSQDWCGCIARPRPPPEIHAHHVDAEGHSLKQLLESSSTQKLFFDVRSDADALYNLYGINLNNVYDLQLLEVAMKRSQRNKAPYVTGLARVIDTYLGAPREWKKVKDEGAALFQPERGGTYEIFERRPLDPRIIAYSAQDVALLFDLKRTLESRMGIWFSDWRGRVARASAAREAESRQRSSRHSYAQ